MKEEINPKEEFHQINIPHISLRLRSENENRKSNSLMDRPEFMNIELNLR